MAAADPNLPPMMSGAGTLVAAALELAGTRLQSVVLDAMNGPSGSQLAALLYLAALTGAILVVAIGGAYRYGRYLLVGPALFLFLTQARVASPGTAWRFGDRDRGAELVKQAAADVRGGARPGAEGGNVARFFQIWNLVVTDVVQSGIKLTAVTSNEVDLHFINALERYQNLTEYINSFDPLLTGFLQIMLNHCAHYFILQTWYHHPGTDIPTKAEIDRRLREITPNVVYSISPDPNVRAADPLQRWLVEIAEAQPGNYTCPQLWERMAHALAKNAEKIIRYVATRDLPPGMTEEQAVERLKRRFHTVQNRSDYQLIPKGVEGDSNLVLLVHELVGRTLLKQIYLGSSSAFRRMNMESQFPWMQVGEDQYRAEAARHLQLLNRTEVWQGKGDFLNAALGMPHLQGLLLFALSVTYPLFALMVLVPGKHTAVGFWMALWAWAKSWDLGFAVVMTVDNMLYHMFPKGPEITTEMVKQPGRVFAALLTIDPNYSAHTYYNLIATCLFAVPFVTAAFVKKGADALVDGFGRGLRDYASRLGGSLATFHRSQLAQTRAAETQGRIYRAQKDSLMRALNDPDFQNAAGNFLVSAGAGEVLNAAKEGKTTPGVAASQLLRMTQDQNQAFAMAQLNLVLEAAAYRESISYESQRAAADAVLLGYNTHDFSEPLPGDALMTAMIARRLYMVGGPANELGKKMLVNENCAPLFRALGGGR